ncbi:dTMP kinase [Halarcobacter anaerophilus]|jgi:dTMP kinase|uniref:Thymidylate kinase n=1 Tax=Halarcobacter anaerophilus TaxID=877500 RepID=A0A4Q0Y320_9BACT|nr:dTMP kinase [Halarcobacter anaerophilus]QDF29256.1 dTMP kinase [Halarcobacter anaerophilus]RXJ64507.1 dTMP kinase [Halarcobacter anaerophilus]
MYVVIEGVDTAGKSTQLDILKNKYQDAIFTKEPGGTKIGLKLREMALNGEAKSKIAEMFLFLADRAEHINEVVKPNKEKMVISDRSVISGIAYASNMPLEIVTTLNLIATSNTLPTHVILLELSKEELTKRLQGKSNDSIESRGIDYLIDIQNRMKRTVEMLNLNHIYIDAALSIEEISKRIEDFING